MVVKQKWMDSVYSDGTALFLSDTCPQINDEITIKMRAAKNSPIQKVYIRYLLNGEETVKLMETCEEDQLFRYYKYTLRLVNPIFLYRFILITDEGVYFYNQKGLCDHACLETYDFRLILGFEAPDWVKESVFYQIFPDRFCNGNSGNDVKDGEYSLNGFFTKKQEWDSKPGLYEETRSLDFFGGDLEGIAEKIGYLKKIGVTSIYINPIFKAYSNHKYDCIDYYHVDEHLGGDKALEELCKVIHENDMKIILDISINHTGKEHPWVKECKSFYYLKEDGEMECWNGVKDLPSLNYSCEALRDIIYKMEDSVLKKWIKPPYEIDGWRFDVGQSVAKMNGDALDLTLWREIRKELKEVNPNIYLLAEHWDDCIRYLQGDMWDATMNYYGFERPARKYLGENDVYLDWKLEGTKLTKNARIFIEETMEARTALPWQIQTMQMNLIGSHDIHRFTSNADVTMNNQKTAVVMLFTFLGVPSIYYGDEVHLKGEKGIDIGARYPMVWNEENWDLEMLNLYTNMVSIRKNNIVLISGSFKYVEVDEYVLCYVRFDKDEAVLFINSQRQKNNKISIVLDAIGNFNDYESLTKIGTVEGTFKNNTLEVELGFQSTGLFKLF